MKSLVDGQQFLTVAASTPLILFGNRLGGVPLVQRIETVAYHAAT